MFPVGLEDAVWKKAGVDVAKLTPAQGGQNAKEGIIPLFKFAGFDLPQIPAIEGGPVTDLRGSVDVDLGGIMGAGLLSLFRVTFGDDGRFLWLEADPALLAPTGRAGAEPRDGESAPRAGRSTPDGRDDVGAGAPAPGSAGKGDANKDATKATAPKGPAPKTEAPKGGAAKPDTTKHPAAGSGAKP
jgi:hypothetical protein